ncbi:homing endonuclease associated repeat-containing protein [Brachybacterium sp. AOP25-B2-12]|uniref:homing endonuclease associated repeat-containing protein n=1 Tax=Brachybacterium sp. AOP25-B2-12 TaxID=3457710 RepID=UPI004033D504
MSASIHSFSPATVDNADRIGTTDAAEPTVDAERALDLAQQGYALSEISETLGGIAAGQIDEALAILVPGGLGAVRTALRRRLRVWRSASPDATWLDAEHAFGIPHTHVLRIVRAPRDDEQLRPDPGDPGFLDLIMTGHDCRDDRAAACARAYAMGATLQEIGDLFGVTRERIRQILGRDTPWSSTELAAATRRLREDRRAEHARAVEAWSLAHPAVPVDRAVTPLGLSEDQVLDLLGPRRSHHRVSTAKATASSRRTDEEILEDLRAYHGETGSTTGAGFRDWARDHDVPGPQTTAIRFGTWNDALAAAGIAAVAGRPRSGFTDDDLWAALVAFVRDPDGGTTAQAAEAWLAARPAAPSVALIRQRLNAGWSEIATRAVAVANGDDLGDPEWAERVRASRDWSTAPEEPDPFDHVRAAIDDLGPRITTAAYQRWARENGRPGVPTLQRRSGLLWNDVLEAAGGTPGKRKVRGSTPEDCALAVADFLLENPTGGSVAFAAWANPNGRPSLPTVVDRWGTWNAARAAALGLIDARD